MSCKHVDKHETRVPAPTCAGHVRELRTLRNQSLPRLGEIGSVARDGGGRRQCAGRECRQKGSRQRGPEPEAPIILAREGTSWGWSFLGRSLAGVRRRTRHALAQVAHHIQTICAARNGLRSGSHTDRQHRARTPTKSSGREITLIGNKVSTRLQARARHSA